jgi:hypothetical protein
LLVAVPAAAAAAHVPAAGVGVSVPLLRLLSARGWALAEFPVARVMQLVHLAFLRLPVAVAVAAEALRLLVVFAARRRHRNACVCV